ncbi:MAG: hypothetical protein H6978_14255 [Gammaproteobacteria bacterium]|nr:hypothetical protein [Gammaproteobacteria bacterium]
MRVLLTGLLCAQAVQAVAADTDLELLEARLLALEAELAENARRLAIEITPNELQIMIAGVPYADGSAAPFAEGQALHISGNPDSYKPLDLELTPDESSTRLIVSWCPATRQEQYEYQPPDRVSRVAIGNAEFRFDRNCPQLDEEGRAMADEACAAVHNGASRDPTQYFTLRQEYKDGLPSTCLALAECVRNETTTPEPVMRRRDVPNDQCTSTAKLQ